MTDYRSNFLLKRTAQYVHEHGSMPFCECGCGETVRMNSRGIPNRFAGVNHQSRVNDMAQLSSRGKEEAAARNGDVPVQKFREVVLRLKEQRGLTWAELADMAGVSVKTLRSAVYVPNKKYVTREWATAFFQRASGMAVTPSEGYRRRAEEVEARIAKAEQDIDEIHAVSLTHQRREEARATRRRQRDELAQSRIDEYWLSHSELPLCACGCGERVEFSRTGYPNKFAANWHTVNKRHGVYA